MSKLIYFFLAAFISITLTSCQTYHIDSPSFSKAASKDPSDNGGPLGAASSNIDSPFHIGKYMIKKSESSRVFVVDVEVLKPYIKNISIIERILIDNNNNTYFSDNSVCYQVDNSKDKNNLINKLLLLNKTLINRSDYQEQIPPITQDNTIQIYIDERIDKVTNLIYSFTIDTRQNGVVTPLPFSSMTIVDADEYASIDATIRDELVQGRLLNITSKPVEYRIGKGSHCNFTYQIEYIKRPSDPKNIDITIKFDTARNIRMNGMTYYIEDTIKNSTKKPSEFSTNIDVSTPIQIEIEYEFPRDGEFPVPTINVFDGYIWHKQADNNERILVENILPLSLIVSIFASIISIIAIIFSIITSRSNTKVTKILNSMLKLKLDNINTTLIELKAINDTLIKIKRKL